MIYPEDWEKITCYDWYEDEKKIWMCLENKNAICEIDKESKNTKILGSFPHNTLGEEELSLSVERCGDYIVFCPFKANDIAMLNIYTGELEFIDLLKVIGKDIHLYTGIEKFYRMVSFKNFVYFFGIKYPAIIKFDLLTKKIQIFNEWMETIERHTCKEAVLFTDGYARKKDEIYIPIGRCNGILRINLDTMEWNYIEIESIVHGILGMTQKENLVWLTEYDSGAKSFFQWNLDNGEFMQIDLPCQDGFYAPLYCDKTLLFFQNYGKRSYQYNLESGTWKDITNQFPELENSGDKKNWKNQIKYFSNKRKRFYRLDLNCNEVYYDEFRIKEIEFLENSWLDFCKRYKAELKDHIMKESKLTIKDYIEIVTSA